MLIKLYFNGRNLQIFPDQVVKSLREYSGSNTPICPKLKKPKREGMGSKKLNNVRDV